MKSGKAAPPRIDYLYPSNISLRTEDMHHPCHVFRTEEVQLPCHILISPNALATELKKMMTTKSGHAQRIINRKILLRLNG